MVTRRTYDDGCAAAHALDLVGERWALLVVRELLLGPKRFTDLRAGLPHASPNVLSQSKPADAPLGVDSLILSFRTMFAPGAAEGLEASYELRMGEDRFRAEVGGGTFEVERGSAERPDATIEGDSATLAELVYEDRHLSEALCSGEVKIEGDEAAVERFLTLFPLPE